MRYKNSTVFVVDDDKAVRESLQNLLDSAGITVQVYACAEDFLTDYNPDQLGCLVLDVSMPGITGLELQQALNKREALLPIIILTGHGDVPMAVKAMKQGALDFIQKPFRGQDLLDQVSKALTSSHELYEKRQRIASVKQQLQTLTPREQQIMQMIIEGNANKVIAIDLGLSQRTVESHRANIMQKLNVSSVADLVRIVTQSTQ